MKIEIHVHCCPADVDGDESSVLTEVRDLKKFLEEKFMSIAKDFESLRKAMDEETTAVAARIDKLTEGLKNSMTDEEVEELKAGFGALSNRLTALGQDPNNPVPPPPPAPPVPAPVVPPPPPAPVVP